MQGAQELLRGSGGQNLLFSLGGMVEQAAVLGDDAIEQLEVRTNRPQIVQFAASDEEDLASGFAQLPHGLPGLVGYLPVVGQRTIVIRGESEKTHSTLRRGRRKIVRHGILASRRAA